MSATLLGLSEFNGKAARVAVDVEARARGVAEGTSNRVATGIRARVRHKLQARLRSAVRVVEEPGATQFVVGFDDAALDASGLFPMVVVWHEFGTKYKSANPAVGDSLSAERGRYLNEMRQAVTPVLEGASR